MSSHQSLTMKLAAALLLLAAAAPIATTSEARAPSQAAAEKMNNKNGQCESPVPSENESAVQQALAAIAIASAKAKEARGLAWKLKAEQDPDSALADCLRSCAQMYSTAYDSLQTSEQILKGVAEPDRELMLELTAAADSVMTCSDELDEQAELESPLLDVNGELGSLVNDCLTLGTSLELYLINNY